MGILENRENRNNSNRGSDPNNFVNKKSLLAGLLPGLFAAYASNKNNSPEKANKNIVYQKIVDISSQLNVIKNITKSIAKNVVVLPAIQRDTNIMRQNLILIAKKLTNDERTSPDSFFKTAEERERIYEEQFNREKTSPSKVENDIEKKKRFDWFTIGLMGTAALGLAKYFSDPEFKEKINKMINVFGNNVFGEENWKGITEVFQNTAKSLMKVLEDNWKAIAVAAGVIIAPLASLHLALATASKAIFGIAKMLWKLGAGGLAYPFGGGRGAGGQPGAAPSGGRFPGRDGKVQMRAGGGKFGALAGLAAAFGLNEALEAFGLPNHGETVFNELAKLEAENYENINNKLPKTEEEYNLKNNKRKLESLETVLKNYKLTETEKVDEIGRKRYDKKVKELEENIEKLKKDIKDQEEKIKKQASTPTPSPETPKTEISSGFGNSLEEFSNSISSALMDQYKAMIPKSPTETSPEKVPKVTNKMEDNILAVVRRFEAGTNDPYNMMNQGTTGSGGNSLAILGEKLTEMTVGEVMRYQQKTGKDKLFAAGAYQIIPSTLEGLIKRGVLGKNDKFNEENQDKLAKTLLQDRIKGAKNNRELLLNISKEWAIFSNPETGKSFHGGKGGNKSSIEADKAMASVLGGGEFIAENNPYTGEGVSPIFDIKEALKDGNEFLKELLNVDNMADVAGEVGEKTGLSYKYIEDAMKDLWNTTLDRLDVPQPVIIQPQGESKDPPPFQGAPEAEISSIADTDFIALLFQKSMWGTPTTV